MKELSEMGPFFLKLYDFSQIRNQCLLPEFPQPLTLAKFFKYQNTLHSTFPKTCGGGLPYQNLLITDTINYKVSY